jgi:stage II sporulation protein D
MRRLLLPLAVLAAVLGLAPSAGAGTLFVLTGRGWGHGVGMSQWGAFGMAQDGSAYRQILRHYYSGTLLAKPQSRTIGVELGSGRSSFVIGSTASFRVSASGKSAVQEAGNTTVRKTRTGRIKVVGIRGSFQSPATFRATTAPLRLGSAEYRGRLVVSVRGAGLRVVNRLGLDAYVRGVVPRESPASWPAAALEAQAVAARSYAFYALVHGGGKCGGAFCPDTRDQVYGGLSGEDPRTNAAVRATAREIVVDGGGNVAQTFFHSSSGGRTANSEDVWGTAVSYLRSVADRDLVRENPNRRWRVLRTPAQLRSGFALPRTPTNLTLRRDSSDRVGSLRASGPGWATIVDGGDSLRWRLELKSNRFWLGLLRLTPARSRLEWRQRSTVSGRVRRVANSTLQRRRAGGSWKTLRSENGRVALRIRPSITTWYRLGPRAFGTTVRIRVQPRLRITSVRARSIRGTMGPKRTGTTVSVQKLVKGSWTTVAHATVRADGVWRAALRRSEGTYRAVAAPGGGLVRGASPTIKVS